MPLHPFVVHFAPALLLCSVVLFIAGTLLHRRPYASSLLTVARWNLWIGAAFALASIGTGFVDYIGARCDPEAIEATVLHRRSGAVTWWSSLIAGIAAWLTRHRPPGPWLMAWLVFVAIAAMTVTWLGTGLTYGHGLGVTNGPLAGGEPCFKLERAR